MSDETKHSGRMSWRESGPHFHVDSILGTVAVVFGSETTRNGGRTGVIGDEGEWNARLFAAAPDLLAALKSLVAAVALDLHPETVREALSRARLAIARADGKS